MKKNTKITIIILLLFLLLLLSLLVYLLSHQYSFVFNRTNESQDELKIETDFAILYFIESSPTNQTVSLGIDFIDNQTPLYKIITLPSESFDGNLLVDAAYSSLPAYISITSNEAKRYVITKLNEKEIDGSIIKNFTNKLNKYLYSSPLEENSLLPYQKLWLSAEGYMKIDDEEVKKEFSQYANYAISQETSKLVITEEFGTDPANYIRNYYANYPYSCLVAKRISESKVTQKDYSDQLCNLPQLPAIDKSKFGIENIETIWGSSKEVAETNRNYGINSTTLLLDYWSQNKSQLDDIYRYNLSEAYKYGMNKEDVCYWMLVNDLTPYKNNLYNYIIHDQDLFNSFNSMYCPSLHKPVQFSYIQDPKPLDVNYFVYDL